MHISYSVYTYMCHTTYNESEPTHCSLTCFNALYISPGRCTDIRSHGHSFTRNFWQGRTFVHISNDHPGHSYTNQITTRTFVHLLFDHPRCSFQEHNHCSLTFWNALYIYLKPTLPQGAIGAKGTVTMKKKTRVNPVYVDQTSAAVANNVYTQRHIWFVLKQYWFIFVDIKLDSDISSAILQHVRMVINVQVAVTFKHKLSMKRLVTVKLIYFIH